MHEVDQEDQEEEQEKRGWPSQWLLPSIQSEYRRRQEAGGREAKIETVDQALSQSQPSASAAQQILGWAR